MLRKTKIICTLGPATEDEAVLRRLMLGGMNAARFNFSHCTHEDAAKKLEAVTRLRRELGLPIATILDTKGPEIRVKTFQNGPIELVPYRYPVKAIPFGGASATRYLFSSSNAFPS